MEPSSHPRAQSSAGNGDGPGTNPPTYTEHLSPAASGGTVVEPHSDRVGVPDMRKKKKTSSCGNSHFTGNEFLSGTKRNKETGKRQIIKKNVWE